MSAERPDGFEEELVARLGARAGSVGGTPPLAALREAGRRRLRRRAAVRGVAAVTLLAAGTGVLGQVGQPGGGADGARQPVGTPTAGSAAGSAPWWSAGPVNGCSAGPSSLRTPGFYPPVRSSGTPASGTSGPGGTGGPSALLAQPGMPGMPPPQVTPAEPRAWFPFDPDLYRASRDIADLAVGPYRDQYFGMCSDEAAHTLYVMRTFGAGDFERAVRERVSSAKVRIEFRDAAGSRVALDALAARIAADAPTYWKSRGVTVVGVAVCTDGAGVRVDVAQPADGVRAEFTDRYGPLVAEVVHRG